MGFLDSIGLGGVKIAFIISAWFILIVVTIFIPFAFLFTVPMMIFLPAITALLLIKRKQSVPEGCVTVDGKLECSAKGI